MAKIILHPTIRRMSGKMGDVVFRLAHSGTMMITKIPDMSKVKWSQAQKAHRRRFKKAVAHLSGKGSESIKEAQTGIGPGGLGLFRWK